MSIFETMRVSMSGLTAQRLRMDVIASNIANVDTTRTPDGGPYLRRRVIFRAVPGAEPAPATSGFQPVLDAARASTSAGQGVAVRAIQVDEDAVRRVYDPSHPEADAEGYVLLPDIDVVTEMTDLLAASRAYEANVTVLNAVKTMASRALTIGRG
ncbi:MAG: flagellar basal body rod protein FlgC [Sphaerobacter sp.]|nr:flagellar basal body rod protein FlgC [Sphaerobacter sp.]